MEKNFNHNGFNYMDFKEKIIYELVKLAILEDRIEDDVTTDSLIEYDQKIVAQVIAKENGIISGIDVFKKTFNMVDPEININVFAGDGFSVKRGCVILEIIGRESSILKAERTALNFLQRLSGIATLTGKFVEIIKPYDVILLDTRKTTPGMRYLEKKAVTDGGGTNHRLNLEDMAMVKDNHIKMAGTISNAVKKIKNKFPYKKIEVEVKDLDEFREALSLNVDIIMLDNFSIEMAKKAVKMNTKSIKLEISGNIKLENIEEKAKTGVDYISVGALTHSFKSLDLSLNVRR